MTSLKTAFVGLELRSPVIAGSAGITANTDRMKRAEDYGAGAVVMKGISDMPVMRTSPTPRFSLLQHDLHTHQTFTLYSYEQASEWAPEEYTEELQRAKDALDIPVIANVLCMDEANWSPYIKTIQEAADAIEVNISCPHGSVTFKGDAVEQTVLRIAQSIVSIATVPIIVKLSPQLSQPFAMVKELERIGVQGVTMFNRLTGLDIDIEAQQPVMHEGYAGHGGPWAVHYPLRWISAIAPHTALDISASGGVMNSDDVVKYLLAGAQTVQTCTAIYIDGYEVLRELNEGLQAYMERKGYETIQDFRGAIQGRIKEMEEIGRHHHQVAYIETRGTPPCRAACPIDQEAQGYITLIGEGKYKQALELIRRNNPFPAICGRVCHHPCEAECTRAEVDDPIDIAHLKRFVVDKAPELEIERVEPVYDERVAVVGAGPAGLTAAHDLAKLGYRVTVFEALPIPGGMMMVGIPAYRLPRQIVQKEIDDIRQLGVEIRTHTSIGKDITLEDLFEEFNAVFFAIGAHKSRRLRIPGEDLNGVWYGTDFLRQVNLGHEVQIGSYVVVIGGGHVAIDSARVARRVGAEKVNLLYRRSKAEMPVQEREIAEALKERVRISYLRTPIGITGHDGCVASVEYTRNTLGEPDEKGRRIPMPIPRSEASIKADTVIVAIGQDPDMDDLRPTLGNILNPDGTLVADPEYGTTARPGLFAGGDVVRGAGMLVDAIAAGQRGALSIHRYLREEDIRARRPTPQPPIVDKQKIIADTCVLKRRQEMPTLPVKDRLDNFLPVDLGFTQEQALEEASRCLQCAKCSNCNECARICIYDGIEKHGGVTQVTDKCDGCGLCPFICPNQAIAMVEESS